MTLHKAHKPVHAGFSLIEMAIVLFIIALLLGGLLPVVSSQMEQQRRNETRKLMAEVRDSLLGYVTANGRLPAPACGTIATGNANAGVELVPASAALCASGIGDIAILPWATLGVSETDAWGNRFTYRVTTLFANVVAPGTSSSFLLSSNGDMTIRESTIGIPIATTIPVVVLSHGVNACGAYMTSGTKIDDNAATPPPVFCNDNDQQENSNNDITIISRGTTATFDDIVIWISSNTLVNRMVTVNKLP